MEKAHLDHLKAKEVIEQDAQRVLLGYKTQLSQGLKLLEGAVVTLSPFLM